MANKYDYYTIKPETAYGDPIYIHSHDRTIRQATEGKINISTNLEKAIKEIHDNYLKSLNALDNAYTVLKNLQDKLVNAGYPTRDGKPYGLTDKYKIIRNHINKLRSDIISGKTVIVHREKTGIDESKAKELLNQQSSSTVENFIMSNGVGEKLLMRLTEILNKAEYVKARKKHGQQEHFTEDQVKQMVWDEFKAYLKVTEKNKDAKAKDMARATRVSYTKKQIEKMGYKKLIEDLKTYIPILQHIQDGQIVDPEKINDENLLAILEQLTDNKKQDIIFKLGYLAELAVYETNNIEYKDKKGNILGKQDASAIGSKKGIYGGDEATTDIKNVFQGIEDAIIYGTSVKLNPRYFRKEWQDKNIASSYPTVSQLAKEDNKALQYYILNYQALILARFPNKDRDMYRDAAKGIRPTPITGGSTKFFDLITEFEKTMMINAFVSSVIGQLFSFKDSDFDLKKVSDAQGLPIILQTIGGQYWTTDLLIKLKEIMQNYSKNPEGIAEFIENYTPYDPYGKEGNESKLKELLIDLYMAKAENKYDKNRVIENNRYEELVKDEKVNKILQEIGKINKIRYSDRLSNLLNKNWKIKFDYSTFLK